MLFSKLIITLVLTVIISYSFVYNANQQYKKGIELTQKSYIKQYKEYKDDLLAYKQFTYVPSSTFFTFVGVSILVGSYELSTFLISLLLKKAFNKRSKQIAKASQLKNQRNL